VDSSMSIVRNKIVLHKQWWCQNVFPELANRGPDIMLEKTKIVTTIFATINSIPVLQLKMYLLFIILKWISCFNMVYNVDLITDGPRLEE